jgi:AsmA protein
VGSIPITRSKSLQGYLMGKLFRILAYLVGALALLIIVAAVVVPMVIDPNDYKDEIAAAVEAKTGRTLTI